MSGAFIAGVKTDIFEATIHLAKVDMHVILINKSKTYYFGADIFALFELWWVQNTDYIDIIFGYLQYTYLWAHDLCMLQYVLLQLNHLLDFCKKYAILHHSTMLHSRCRPIWKLAFSPTSIWFGIVLNDAGTCRWLGLCTQSNSKKSWRLTCLWSIAIPYVRVIDAIRWNPEIENNLKEVDSTRVIHISKPPNYLSWISSLSLQAETSATSVKC